MLDKNTCKTTQIDDSAWCPAGGGYVAGRIIMIAGVQGAGQAASRIDRERRGVHSNGFIAREHRLEDWNSKYRLYSALALNPAAVGLWNGL